MHRMIGPGCKSLFRFDVAWKSTNSCVITYKSKRIECFQGYCSDFGVNYNKNMFKGKDKLSPMDPSNKPKPVSRYPIQRPVCNQASSKEESSVRNAGAQSSASIGKHTYLMEVGASLIRFISGKGGSTQKKIEEEMGVKIIIPSSKKEESVIIEGMSAQSVTRASKKAVKSPQLDYSHFISLPLAIYPELVDKLVNFQNSILGFNGSSSSGEDKDQRKNKGKGPVTRYPPQAGKSPSLTDLGIEKSIFINPKTFHLTVLMLKLGNQDRVDTATKVLKNVSAKVIDALDGRPISIKLEGLKCMRGTFDKARILYAPVETDENRLLRACHVIIDAYTEAGLVMEKDAKQRLKLHATVMNAGHRKRNNTTPRLDYFDARGIMEQYGSKHWGDYLIREAHLSQRFAYDEHGYYRRCASIPFPKLRK